MIDAGLSGLERLARCGDVEAAYCFAVGLERAGRKRDAVHEFGRVLESGIGDLYGLAQRGVLSSGLPWVEFDPKDRSKDRPEFVRFYNVLHQGFGDVKRERYVFEWDVDWFKHEHRSWCKRGFDYFTQDGLCSILDDEKVERRLAMASEVHSLVLSLEWALKLGLQQVDVHSACNFVRTHLAWRPLTLSRVNYDDGIVLQDYRRPEERTFVNVSGESGFVRDLSDGQNVVRAVLNAGQSVQKLDRLYNDFLGVWNGVYVWRLPQGSSTRAAVLVRAGGLGIQCDGNSRYMTARLVIVHKAEDFF